MDISFSFGIEVCRSAKLILILDYSFCISLLASSMAFWWSSCVGDGDILAGWGTEQNKSIMGHSPSGPIIACDANIAIWRHYVSDSSFFDNVFRSLVYSLFKSAFYLSTIPMDLGVSLGASSTVISAAATFSLNYLDMYDDPWLTSR